MSSFHLHLPTEIVFGRGRVGELAERLDPRFERILIVTDRNIAEKSPVLKTVFSKLGSRRVSVFSDVEENPAFASIERGARMARATESQLVIGVGGGSPMDAAKGIALRASNDQALLAYVRGRPPENPPLPIVCLPTTSGTGSEVTPYAVFSDPENRDKVGYAHRSIFPILSIVDPELTYSMPSAVVVNTGLDALTHALESFLSTKTFPLNDGLALYAVDSILADLGKAARKDADSMDRMSYASMLAGINITLGGTILLHLMGYGLTMSYGIPHGRANAALLPAVLDYLRIHSTVKDKIRSIDERFEPFEGVRAFIEDLGVSTRISSYGVKEDELETFAKKVIIKSDIKITPAPVAERDIVDIYRSAL